MKSIFKFILLILLLFLCGILCVSCEKTVEPEPKVTKTELHVLSSIELPFTEPSGIAFSEALQKMWIVSGGDQHIYMLDTTGTVEQQLSYTGTDLEGIAFDATDSTLWVVDEATAEIVHLDRSGNILFRKKQQYSVVPNKGLEGITIAPDHTLYLLNELDPSVLFELDSTYSVVQTYPLDFAQDYSDISYNPLTNEFIILSDESSAFFLWKKEQGVRTTYQIKNSRNEGIAFDGTRNVYYIVNDSNGKLYYYKLVTVN